MGIQPRSVDEAQVMRPNRDAFFQIVTSGARLSAHECAFVSDQAIKEAAFARVWFSHDDGSDSIAEDRAVMSSGDQTPG